MRPHTDPWGVLGIKRDASADEIKTAYRRLAKDHHPDRGGDPNRFIEIQNAYQQLTTPPQPQPTAQNHSDFGDLFNNHFEEFFSRFGFEFNNQSHQSQRNNNFETQAKITLAESITGSNRTIRINDNGAIKTIDIVIPPGSQNGDVVKYAGMGSSMRADVPPGSLYVKILIEPFEDYQIQEGNLCCERTVSVWQALLGTQLTVLDPFGSSIQVQVPPSTASHTILRIPERGGFCRNRNKRADILIRLTIQMPKITPEQHQIIQNWVDSDQS